MAESVRASTESRGLPPVEEVIPGLWSIAVPMPDNPLRFVFVHALETDEGPMLLDTGWNTDVAVAALEDGLAKIGSSIAKVQGVIVTHVHPDHYGLAERMREASGARVGMHAADAELIGDRYLNPEDLIERMRTSLHQLGAPDSELSTLSRASMPVLPFVYPVHPDWCFAERLRAHARAPAAQAAILDVKRDFCMMESCIGHARVSGEASDEGGEPPPEPELLDRGRRGAGSRRPRDDRVRRRAHGADRSHGQGERPRGAGARAPDPGREAVRERRARRGGAVH